MNPKQQPVAADLTALRETFEVWFCEDGNYELEWLDWNRAGMYSNADTQNMFEAWCARAALSPPPPHAAASAVQPASPAVEVASERVKDDDERNCSVCGTPVRYGSRHSTCGAAIMRAEKAAALNAIPSVPAPSARLPDDHEVLEYCDTHAGSTFASAVFALTTPPAATFINGHDSRCPAAYPGGTNCTCERAAASSTEPASIEVTDSMALAFHQATTDGMIGADELEDIKAGLRAVLCNLATPTPAVAVPASLTDEQIDGVFAEHFSGFVTLAHQRNAARALLALAIEPVKVTTCPIHPMDVVTRVDGSRKCIYCCWEVPKQSGTPGEAPCAS